MKKIVFSIIIIISIFSLAFSFQNNKEVNYINDYFYIDFGNDYKEYSYRTYYTKFEKVPSRYVSFITDNVTLGKKSAKIKTYNLWEGKSPFGENGDEKPTDTPFPIMYEDKEGGTKSFNVIMPFFGKIGVDDSYTANSNEIVLTRHKYISINIYSINEIQNVKYGTTAKKYNMVADIRETQNKYLDTANKSPFYDVRSSLYCNTAYINADTLGINDKGTIYFQIEDTFGNKYSSSFNYIISPEIEDEMFLCASNGIYEKGNRKFIDLYDLKDYKTKKYEIFDDAEIINSETPINSYCPYFIFAKVDINAYNKITKISFSYFLYNIYNHKDIFYLQKDGTLLNNTSVSKDINNSNNYDVLIAKYTLKNNGELKSASYSKSNSLPKSNYLCYRINHTNSLKDTIVCVKQISNKITNTNNKTQEIRGYEIDNLASWIGEDSYIKVSSKDKSFILYYDKEFNNIMFYDKYINSSKEYEWSMDYPSRFSDLTELFFMKDIFGFSLLIDNSKNQVQYLYKLNGNIYSSTTKLNSNCPRYFYNLLAFIINNDSKYKIVHMEKPDSDASLKLFNKIKEATGILELKDDELDGQNMSLVDDTTIEGSEFILTFDGKKYEGYCDSYIDYPSYKVVYNIHILYKDKNFLTISTRNNPNVKTYYANIKSSFKNLDIDDEIVKKDNRFILKMNKGNLYYESEMANMSENDISNMDQSWMIRPDTITKDDVDNFLATVILNAKDFKVVKK